MKNSLNYKILTVYGIPIEVNLSWFVVLGLVTYSLSYGYFPLALPGLQPLYYLVMGLTSAVLLFICLLLHELAHSIVAERNKLPISKITLFIFGGVAHMGKEPSSPKVEFKMAIAGPLMSLFLALIFGLFTLIAVKYSFPIALIAVSDYLSFLNAAVAIFNLIPGFPLDGGRILRAIIWHFTKDFKKATHIASYFGKTFALVLMAFGLLSILNNNFISGVWLIFLGFFLQEAAELSYRQVVMKNLLDGIFVKDIMSRNVISVKHDLSIKQLIDLYFFRFRHNCFPVIKDDTVIGLITFHDAKEVDKNIWDSQLAEDILIPLNEDLVIGQNAPVISALSKLSQNGINRLLVIEGSKIVGIISQKDILKLFTTRSHPS